jgi:hypothetical protein
VCPIAVPAPIPPAELLAILQLYGYKVLTESSYNWVLAREEDDVPIVLGKRGDAVPVEVMENMFEHSGMNLAVYLALKTSLQNGGKNRIH